MMAGHAARGGIFCVVVGDDQSVDGEGILFQRCVLAASLVALRRARLSCHAQGEPLDGSLYGRQGGVFDALALHGVEAQRVEPSHAGAPRGQVLVAMHQREGYPLDVALAHLIHVFQRQRARGEVAGVGIVLVGLHQEPLEVVVRDDCLAADYDVAVGLDALWNAADGRCQVGDVGADMSVAARHHLGQPPLVVGHHQRQSV